MEKVSLRAYIHEIDKMVEGGKLDEAVAHCQHILETYPMNIDTYRMLGKAYLEAKRYSDAAEMFLRVINAVPDDFVSHVGLSIISDDEARLSDSIWHMERAFEVQPSNSAIQNELRRLYGKRDGVEPSKIRLSRDALANMYSQGELYNQAISEIRSILEQDPNRPDLQVMLMRVYFRSGQKVEAVERANDLLNKNPLCMDALRILVDVLPSIGQPENVYAYRQQLVLLDPYSAYTSDSAFSSNQVVDSAVELYKLDYRPAEIPKSPISFKESTLETTDVNKPTDLPPEWMQTPAADKPESSSIPDTSEGIALTENAATENAPVQARTFNEQEAQEMPEAGLENIGERQSDNSDAKNNFPDWLYPLSSAEVNDQAKPEFQVPGESLSASDTDQSGVLKPSASAESFHEEPVEPQKPAAPDRMSAASNIVGSEPLTSGDAIPVDHIGSQESDKTVTAIGKDLSEFFKSTTSSDVQEVQSIESLKPLENQPEGQKDFPNWPPPTTPDEVSTNQNVESGTESTFIPTKLSEPGSSSQEKSMENSAFPDWLIAIGAGKTGEIIEESAISDTQPISAKSVPEPQSLGQFESNETAVEEPTKPIGLTQSGDGEFPQPVEEIKPPETGDISTWRLESLPVQPGAKPEELITGSQEPLREESSKIIEPGSQIEQNLVSAVQEPLRSPEDILPIKSQELSGEKSTGGPEHPVLEVPGATEGVPYIEPAADITFKPEDQPFNEEKATMDWLEGLSNDQVTQQDEIVLNEGESPLITGALSQESVNDLPAVAAQQEVIPPLPELVGDENAETESLPTSYAPTEKTEEKQETGSSWSGELANEQPAAQTSVEAPPISTEKIGDEENAGIPLVEDRVDLGEEHGNEAIESASAEQPAENIEELPDWLKDLEKPQAPVESPKTDDDFLAWLNTPSQISESESTQEVEVPAWMDENAPVAKQTVPTMPEEWIPVEEKPAASPEISSIQEPLVTNDWTQAGKPEMTEKIPAAIEHTQVTESEQTAGTVHFVEPAVSEEAPAFMEQSQVAEPEKTIEHPEINEPMPTEGIPPFLEHAQVAGTERTVKRPQVVEPMAQEEAPAFFEQTHAAELGQTSESPQDIKPVKDDEIPALLEQTRDAESGRPTEPPPSQDIPGFLEQQQVTGAELTVEPSQEVESGLKEEIPAFLEHTRVVEPAQTVESPLVSEPEGTEETPPFLEHAQVVGTEHPIELPQVSKPVTTEEISALIEPPKVVEPEQIVESPQVFEPEATEGLPITQEQPQIFEPEHIVESHLGTEKLTPEEIPGVPEQSQISEPEQLIETSASSESTNEIEPETILPVTPPRPPVIQQAGTLPPVPSEDKDADLLSSAQSSLDQKSLEEAMRRYTQLIRKGRLLPEVIHDLQSASSLFPTSMNVWQTLGDAYMRANRLQDALDAYTKAEELLR